jgi:hypothetical protein
VAETIDIFTRKKVTPVEGGGDETPPAVVEHLIEMLEDMLGKAREGHLIGVCMLGRCEGESIMHAWTPEMFEHPYTFLGQLEEMKHRVLQYLAWLEDEE